MIKLKDVKIRNGENNVHFLIYSHMKNQKI